MTVSSRSDRALWLPVGALGVVALLMLVFSTFGNPFPAGLTVLTLAETAIRAGVPALAYLLAGVGLGRLLMPLYRGSRDPLAMQVALGISMMLMLSHLLGVLGLFGGAAGRLAAGALIVVGLALLGQQLLTAHRLGMLAVRRPLVWAYASLGAPGTALMLVAASSPPGWLWESEGRGYDALSYHLQLPQEWIAMGRIAPLEHNVYSYLPSYIEAAFYHVGVVMKGSGGLLAGDGSGVLMAQWLHAGVALIGAFLIGRMVMAWVDPARRASAASAARENDVSSASGVPVIAGVLAGALSLSVPWVMVTGSLAYNDLGVVALLAAALIATVDRGLSALRRGAVVGLLIGVACGVKPTALLFAGVPAGLALLVFARPREWGMLVLAGSVAGLAMLAPWLVRNAAFAGNPVFPFATSVLGMGHWESEQVARYARAHTFEGGIVDRLRMMVLVDPSDPAGARHRGMLHPQWSIFFPLVLVMAGMALASARTRLLGLVLCAMLAVQLVLWLSATHVQSRFLLPMLVPGCALFGIVIAHWMERAKYVGIGGGAFVLLFAVNSVLIFAAEPHVAGQGPNAMLAPGPLARSGELFRDELQRALPRERVAFLQEAGPEAFVNLALPAGSIVYLAGDATPLYYAVPVVYATTWDRSLLAPAIVMHPESPAQWASALREAGVTHVMVNYSELARLGRSGFLDPALSVERLELLTEHHAQPMNVWAEAGMVLYELHGAGGGVMR